MADRFEIEPKDQTRLEGCDRFLFQIPESVIFDESLGDRRITAFSYFMFYRNIVDEVNFSIDSMVRWAGKKPNKNKGKINHKFLEAVNLLEESGYVELLEEPSNSACSSAKVNMDFVRSKCDEERYAVVYLDELDKILRYTGNDPNDRHMGNEIVLMVFACLRSLIYQRRNELRVDEVSVDDRRSRSPDAYDCYFCDLADSLGLSERQVSKAVDVLNDLGLIYSETLPRSRSGDKWNTNTTIFCNRYKREKGYLLESGEEYYLREVENKKRKMASYRK